MVRGRVVVDCQLSGVPDLVLKLSQPHLLDDVAFHSCVRLARFQREKVTASLLAHFLLGVIPCLGCLLCATRW